MGGTKCVIDNSSKEESQIILILNPPIFNKSCADESSYEGDYPIPSK